MKKTVTVFAIAALLLFVFTSSVFAQNAGSGGGQYETCLRDTLNTEQQARFDQIIGTYSAEVSKLREEMSKLRESGDFEAFQEVKAKRFTLMEEKRAALREILPEEFAERFQNYGKNMRNFGVDKGSGGFGIKGGCGR